ncbi:GNAT family acetyltraansferase [Afipia sp. P52-10]|uniref:GNAT family N-acetyltransferase n=1 Tax=Afipia sp. P52-10 TaxID=1429916 RepID=UPI0003DEFB77|nr:GNAT family N-acetyltransferase [Afipia sp. P52-10]ETR74847.1 GNAT family acetyltraansferase [Afipia sp. P52-10]
MTIPIVIRQAGPTDRAALSQVLQETFESTWRPNISVAAAEAYLRAAHGDTYVARHGLAFWLAELAGEVAGFVHWDDDFIEALHVRPRFARRGIGGRLMDVAERAIARAGFPAVRLETDTFNEGSRAFYAARGYAEAGRYPDEEWNSGLTTILFVKQLGE